jgi:hypothetical protein
VNGLGGRINQQRARLGAVFQPEAAVGPGGRRRALDLDLHPAVAAVGGQHDGQAGERLAGGVDEPADHDGVGRQRDPASVDTKYAKRNWDRPSRSGRWVEGREARR